MVLINPAHNVPVLWEAVKTPPNVIRHDIYRLVTASFMKHGVYCPNVPISLRHAVKMLKVDIVSATDVDSDCARGTKRITPKSKCSSDFVGDMGKVFFRLPVAHHHAAVRRTH